jgi:hypothetical protein
LFLTVAGLFLTALFALYVLLHQLLTLALEVASSITFHPGV